MSRIISPHPDSTEKGREVIDLLNDVAVLLIGAAHELEICPSCVLLAAASALADVAEKTPHADGDTAVTVVDGTVGHA